MLFTEINTFTYVGNIVSVNGIDRDINTKLDTLIVAVQFHLGRDYLLEEGTNTKVPFAKYQSILDEWVEAEAMEVPPTQDELDKVIKKGALNSITVTTSYGNEFDGDDIARSDMLSAIQAADTLQLTEHNWKLADNTWKVVSLAELKEASALAIQAKGTILAG